MACGTNVEHVGPSCDSTQCAAGNTCLPYGGELKCRKTCSSNTDAATACPAGYTCLQADPSVQPFCVQNTDGVTVKATGQYGFGCNAAEGFADNKACDTAQGFACYGISPTDGDAYCTRYQCTTDRECGAGFWCATINAKPNVSTATRKVGQTTTACLKRAYCATCTSDLDCPAQGGKTAHCIPDNSGAAFCSAECTATTECSNDQKCTNFGLGYKSCYPRAGVCVGDGTICSPCRSDADCGEDGACVKSEYSTEKSCAKKSKITCKTGAVQGTDFDCPKPTNGAKAQIRCLGSVFDTVPVDYCHGLYGLGESGDVGCWTPDR